MPTASELGLLNEGNAPASPLTAGSKLEINKMPEFKESKDGKEYVIIPTLKGNYYSFGSAVLGSLRSSNPKSIGGLLSQAVEQKKSLTVWVTEHEANNGSGNMLIGLSAFPPRK